MVFAMMGGSKVEQFDLTAMFRRRGQLIFSTLRNRSNEYKTMLNNQFGQHFNDALVQRRILPVIDQVFSWQQAEQAHQRMAGNQTTGKLVLTL